MAELYEEPSEESNEEPTQEKKVSLEDIKVENLDEIGNLFKNTNLTAKEIILIIQCFYLCKIRHELMIARVSFLKSNESSPSMLDHRIDQIGDCMAELNSEAEIARKVGRLF